MLNTPGHETELDINIWIVGNPKFPELIGNIFGGIRRSAVAADENLVAGPVTFIRLRLSLPKGQNPAARRWPTFWLFQQVALLEYLKCALPQSRFQNNRLPGEQIVGDVEARHGFEMSLHYLLGEVGCQSWIIGSALRLVSMLNSSHDLSSQG